MFTLNWQSAFMAEALQLDLAKRAPSHAARHQQSAFRPTVSVDDVTLVAFSETCKPRSEKKAAPAPDCLSRYLERVDQRIQRAKSRRFRLPRPPLVRAWPVVREMAMVMGGTVVLVLALPPAFDALPAPFDIREGESAAAQARAALLGASVVGALFLFNFVAYALLYTHSWLRLLHTLVSVWVGVGLGVPLALFLLRAAQAAGVPLDAPSWALLVWNLAVPGVLLAQWAPTRRRFQRTRIAYADSLAVRSRRAEHLHALGSHTLTALRRA